MSKRLQVLLAEDELNRFRRMARNKGVTLAAWVRQALRQAEREEPIGDAERKLAAIRAAARHAFPAPDVDQMNAEIARGYEGNYLGDSR